MLIHLLSGSAEAGASVAAGHNEEGEDWDNQDAADLDAQAYLQDLADRPEMYDPDAGDARMQDDDDYAETIQQVPILYLFVEAAARDLLVLFQLPDASAQSPHHTHILNEHCAASLHLCHFFNWTSIEVGAFSSNS